MARRRGLDSQVTETPPTFAEKERGTLPLDLLLNVNIHVGISTWWVRAWAKLSHRSHLPFGFPVFDVVTCQLTTFSLFSDDYVFVFILSLGLILLSLGLQLY